MMRLLLIATTLALLAPPSRAEVKLHHLFSDHMILPRDVPAPVFGTAAPNEPITVTLAKDGQVATKIEVVADDKGNWQGKLPATPAGTGYTLTIKGSDEIKLTDVLVGDVWICSGQSNMEWTVGRLNRDDQGKTVAAAATNPMVRLYTVGKRVSMEPQTDIPRTETQGTWLECTPENVLNFSAVGYFFGRDIQKSQNIPIGLISTNWGGTPAEAWTSREALEAVPELKYYNETRDKQFDAMTNPKVLEKYEEQVAKWRVAAAAAKENKKPIPRQPQKPGVNQNSASALYNGMLAPLFKYPVRGAIWYQGESNSNRAQEYRKLFPAMISDWRKHFNSELPFFLVQLAPFSSGNSAGVNYAELRDAQYFATKTLPKVGSAVISDVGEENDIHPQKKEPVGQRLALSAREIAYGEKIISRGPEFKSLAVKGDMVMVNYDLHGSMFADPTGEIVGFQLAGDDGKFLPATAKIEGDSIALTAAGVETPKFVRYGWVNFAKPQLNLFNKEGLPAQPFRTDELPWTTK